jgi:predicted naringenin-chalcone synthase
MSAIRSTAIAVPSHTYDQSTVLEAVRNWLGDRAERFSRVLDAYDRGLVSRRASVLPIEEVFRPRTFAAKNRIYMEAAVELGTEAVIRCLDDAGLRPDEVDFFISASCTGFMIPSVDAVIAHRLGMKPALARLPITQHGCAGGAVALRQAHDHLIAHPDHKVLVLAVEIPSVTFQHEDYTATNIISASLFGDGAAAVLLTAEGGANDPHILGTDSRMFPNSADLMGFDMTEGGLRIVLSKRVPQEIRAHAPDAISEFLAANGRSLEEIDHFLLHPGGRKIIEGFESAFGLGAGALDRTRSVLERHGNLSSATVLFILDEFQRAERGKDGDLGLLVAFGPGFGCESLLLGWGPTAQLDYASLLPAHEGVL